MRFKKLLPFLLPFLFLLQNCGNEEELAPPEITIFQPEENSSFNLPTTMLVEFTLKGSLPMKYIKVGIDGENQVPLFSPKYIYPDSSSITTSVELELGTLLQQDEGPYYVHITADDGKRLHHAFQPVNLVNASLNYKGFYLFTRPSVNQVRIKYFDQNFNETQFYGLDGEFVDAQTSVRNDLLFVATAIPGKLYALEFEDQAVKWQQQPELPYPDYTDLYEDGNYLYVGYENGRIAALSENSGSQNVITKTLVDSIPEKIGVSGNYFIGDFKQRKGQNRVWVSFYRATGAVFQKFHSDIKVIGFYPSIEDGAVDFIGNEGGKGIYGRFDFENNYVNNQTVFDEGEILYSCKLNDTKYLVAVGQTVYSIAIDGGSHTVFAESDSEISGLDCDPVTFQVFVVTENNVLIYKYPDAELLKTITSSEENKAVRLRFGY